MAVVAISDSILTDIADAIRSKNGTEDTYKPSEMPDAIEAISGGGITPTGTKNITANGTNIDVAQYAYADVDVPNTYASGDEGKVVSNGSLVSQSSDTVTTNGTVDTTLINSLTVNVSGGGGNNNFAKGSFTIETGVTTYTFDTGIDYDCLILFEDATSGEGTRYLRVITSDFTKLSGQNIDIVTTNNSGAAVTGFYNTDSTWGSKNGTSFTYTSQSNSTKLGAGKTYRWVAWKE